MDSNRDEALRCIGIAKEAISSGNKERALKLIKIAQRLDANLSVDDLLQACERIDSPSPSPASFENENIGDRTRNGAASPSVEERKYTAEHVQLIREINRSKDYYDVLSLEKSCSTEEIRKAYRKVSLRVHPDKNKAPGAEDAFKKVSKAFKCLSEEDSRRVYDQTGGVGDEFEDNQQHVRRRRRAATSEFYDEDFDPNEIFRAFFGQTTVFHSSHVFRTRGVHTQTQHRAGAGGPSAMVLVQLVVFLLIILFAYSPTREPEYSLQKSYSYQFSRVTQRHGVQFFVKSPDFDRSYPVGSESRANLEDNVVQEYKNILGRYCHIELQRRQWSRSMPTPNCDKYRSFGVA